MRALIVAGAGTADSELVARLASSSDVVVAADSGGTACLRAGVMPAAVVGDLDSLGSGDEARLRESGARFVVVPAEKDVSDLDVALAEVRSAGATEVLATGVFGGRLDHTLASIGSLAREADLRCRVFEPGLGGWVLSERGRATLSLSGTGALLSLFAVGGDSTVSCAGFRYPLWHERLSALDSRGLSNVIEDEIARVRVFEGTLLALSIATDGTVLARQEESGPEQE